MPSAGPPDGCLKLPSLWWRLWAALGSVESIELSQAAGVGSHRGLELDGCQHLKRRVAALAIVEDLQILEDRVGQLHSGLPCLSVEQLRLHTTPERLDHGVIKAHADRAHRREQSRVNGSAGEGPRRELGPLITVNDGRTHRSARLNGHAECVRDEVVAGSESIDQPTTLREKTSSTTAQ